MPWEIKCYYFRGGIVCREEERSETVEGGGVVEPAVEADDLVCGDC
jgi:hypothetical protein